MRKPLIRVSKCILVGDIEVERTYIRNAEVSEGLLLVRGRLHHGLGSRCRGRLCRLSWPVHPIRPILRIERVRVLRRDRSRWGRWLCGFRGWSRACGRTGSSSGSLLLVGSLEFKLADTKITTPFGGIRTLRVSLVSFLPFGAALVACWGVGGALPAV